MSCNPEISKHYERGDLLERLQTELIDDGVDPDRPTIQALAHFDYFHGRGLTTGFCEVARHVTHMLLPRR